MYDIYLVSQNYEILDLYFFLQASLRNDSLLQSSIRIQNDTQRDTPNNRIAKASSPQNSFRNRSNTYSPVPQVISSISSVEFRCT